MSSNASCRAALLSAILPAPGIGGDAPLTFNKNERDLPMMTQKAERKTDIEKDRHRHGQTETLQKGDD